MNVRTTWYTLKFKLKMSVLTFKLFWFLLVAVINLSTLELSMEFMNFFSITMYVVLNLSSILV